MSNTKDTLLGRRGELLRDIREARQDICIVADGRPTADSSQILRNAQAKLFAFEKELTEVDNELDGLDRTPV